MHWSVLLLILNQHNNENSSSIPFDSRVECYQNYLLYELRWNLFQIYHFKQYKTFNEHLKRKSIFFNTLSKIQLHNKRYKQGLETFKMGVNQFSDMTEEEFEEIYSGNDFLSNEILFDESFPSNYSMTQIKAEKNWFTPKIPVKDQGACGSCWTFATTGLLEYDYFYKYYKGGKVLSLSEQELLDCVPKENYGCKGGIPYYALQFVKKNGINFETDYPYKKHKNKCKIRSKKAPQIVQTVQMTSKSEKAILENLSYSPVIVGVYFNHKVWKNYDSGYITAKACTKKKINHAIVILGVVNEGGRKLWFARNSFGKTWGIKGHLKLAMNENACEIGTSPGFYVTTVKL